MYIYICLIFGVYIYIKGFRVQRPCWDYSRIWSITQLRGLAGGLPESRSHYQLFETRSLLRDIPRGSIIMALYLDPLRL